MPYPVAACRPHTFPKVAGDSIAPTLSTVVVSSNGATVTLTFSEAVTANATGLSLVVSGAGRSLTYVSGSGTDTVVYSASQVYLGQTCTLNYTPGTIADLASNALASITGKAVTNNSTALNRTGLELELLAGTGYYSATSGGSLVTTNGSTVKRWEDQSGNSNHATDSTGMTVVTNAANSLSGLAANGLHLDTTNFLGSGYDHAWTMFIVSTSDGTEGNVVLFSSSGSSAYFVKRLLFKQTLHLPGLFGGDIGPSDPLGNSASNDTIKITTFRYDGSQLHCDVNGIGQVKWDYSGNLGLSGGWRLGNYYGGGFDFPGNIVEVLCFKSAMTNADVKAWQASLRTKFGVSSRYYLKPTVCFNGNSLTSGIGASSSAASYPNQCFALGHIGRMVDASGAGGETVRDMTTPGVIAAESSIDPVWQNTGTITTPTQICVPWEITNELRQAGFTAVHAYTNYQTYCLARKAVGFKVIAVTVLPRVDGDAGTTGGRTPEDGQNFETRRATCNAWLRDPARIGVDFDALADAAADSRLQNTADTTYFSDGTHLTDAGYAIVAGLVDAAIVSLP